MEKPSRKMLMKMKEIKEEKKGLEKMENFR
jgi:hypothetical protein